MTEGDKETHMQAWGSPPKAPRRNMGPPGTLQHQAAGHCYSENMDGVVWEGVEEERMLGGGRRGEDAVKVHSAPSAFKRPWILHLRWT